MLYKDSTVEQVEALAARLMRMRIVRSYQMVLLSLLDEMCHVRLMHDRYHATNACQC